MRKKREDVRLVHPGQLDWSPERVAGSLEAIRKAVNSRATDLYDSYNLAIRSKRRWAKVLRTGAMVLSAAAGIWLLLSAKFYENGTHLYWSPLWAAVTLAVAAGLIPVDNFYGFTKSWMRYSRVTRELAFYIDAWQLDWELLACSLGDGKDTGKVERAIRTARTFSKTVDKIVIDENREWMADMKKSLEEIEDNLKEQRERYDEQMAAIEEEARL